MSIVTTSLSSSSVQPVVHTDVYSTLPALLQMLSRTPYSLSHASPPVPSRQLDQPLALFSYGNQP